MSITMRQYQHLADYQRMSEFLTAHYQPDNRDGNWIEPAWEYMHYHPLMDTASIEKIAIWEEAGEIVGVAHYEWFLGEGFFEFHPGYRHLRQDMLEYAEKNLYGILKKDGRKFLHAYVNDNDPAFMELVQSRGYEKHSEDARPMAKFEIPDPFPAISLPDGFRLTSLAEDYNWEKVHRVLWRGFNHPGEPSITPETLEERRKMFETPSARLDLKVAAQAPNGEFASFCGMFYDPTHRFAYVEPVATDPTYRRMGLGKAAVLEGIRRCGSLGATVAYVGSDQQFYLALGFQVIYTSECWVKYLT